MVQLSHPYLTTGKTIQTFVEQSLELSWFSVINIWMSPSRHEYTPGQNEHIQESGDRDSFNPQLGSDWHKWPQKRSLILSAHIPSLWHEAIGLHEKISLGILPAPTLEPKDFNKEWKAFLPFGEISVKQEGKEPEIISAGPSPPDHSFLTGDKGSRHQLQILKTPLRS